MNKNKNKIIFFGTPNISATVLNALLEKKYNIIAIVTQPDKPSNHQKIIYSPVKQIALQKKIKLFQPAKLLPIVDEIAALKADLIISCAYGLIIPKKILDLPKYHCINVHPSLLPKYRGPSPINYALFNNDKTTGVTIMYMDQKMDTGDILLQKAIPILDEDNYDSLYLKLTNLSIDLLAKTIDDLFANKAKPIKQDDSKATYTKLIMKEDERIDWKKTGLEIIGLIRGLATRPCAHVIYNNELIKIYQATLDHNNKKDKAANGQIVDINKNGIMVKCANGYINITMLQLPGKKPMLVSAMINGNHIFKIGGKFI